MEICILFSSTREYIVIPADELEKERVWAAISDKPISHTKWHHDIVDLIGNELMAENVSPPDFYILENETCYTLDEVNSLLRRDFSNIRLFYKDEPGHGIIKI